MSHEAYAVVSTYYEHGEYRLEICYGQSELKNYLIKCYHQYDDPAYKIDEIYEMDLDEIINVVVSEGDYQIKNQCGFGVREIKEI